MNFLIFDKDRLSFDLVDIILADFRHVTLVADENSSLSIPSTSLKFLLVKQVNVRHAQEVIDNLFKHENDPFDAIIMFNAASYSDFQNILQTMKRLRRQPPHLFLIFTNQSEEIDKKINKVLKEHLESVPWTFLNCNGVNSSGDKNYKVTTKPDPNNQQPINSTALFEFLCNEIKTKKYLHKTIFIY